VNVANEVSAVNVANEVRRFSLRDDLRANSAVPAHSVKQTAKSAILGSVGIYRKLRASIRNNCTAEHELSASQQSVMRLASKQDRKTSGKSRTQADLSHLDRRMTLGCSQRQRAFIMCDYSLDFVASRPARVGDKLVSTRFRNSVTSGFAAIGGPDVVVCLLPGTEVAFEREVECGAAFRRRLGQKVARFRQVNLELPTAHHDALEFPDGEIALVTDLCEGQHATVLQLPAQPTIAAEADAEDRIAYVE
jgi:hypothetical protein